MDKQYGQDEVLLSMILYDKLSKHVLFKDYPPLDLQEIILQVIDAITDEGYPWSAGEE